MNECDTNEDNCDSNATCENNVGGFKCKCNNGFQGSGIMSDCNDINECDDSYSCDVSSTLDHNCDIDSVCNNNDRSFTCSCSRGFTQEKSYCSCKNINECFDASLNDCRENELCQEQTPMVCTNVLVFLDGQVMVQVALTSLNLMPMQTNWLGSNMLAARICDDIDECTVDGHDCHDVTIYTILTGS